MGPKWTLLTVGLCVWLGSVEGQYDPYDSPLPPRPVIPGAVPLGEGGGGGGRRIAFRQQPRRLEPEQIPTAVRGRGRTIARRPAVEAPRLRVQDIVPRAQRPPASDLPRARPVVALPPRPVVEDSEEDSEEASPSTPAPPQQQPPFRTIDDFPVPSRQQYRPNNEDEQDYPRPQQSQPSPEPPFSRQPAPQQEPQYNRQPPTIQPPQEPQPQFRPQPLRPQVQLRPQSRPRPQPQPQPPVVEQQRRPAPRPQEYSRPAVQEISRPEKEYSKTTQTRGRKPTAQVLRKYRDDNADGSITWGFENDDGTFKEETIGTDCVTRGKYGYIDPDGVRREYTYSSGIPCDKEKDAEAEASEGYIDYTNNRYVKANGESIDLDNMVKHRARRPIY